jgi:hypothetical protein
VLDVRGNSTGGGVVRSATIPEPLQEVTKVGLAEFERFRRNVVSDPSRERDEFVPPPPLRSEARKGPRGRDVIADLQVRELGPTVQRHERMLTGRDDGAAERRAETERLLGAARPDLPHAAFLDAKVGVARERPAERHAPSRSVFHRDPPA